MVARSRTGCLTCRKRKLKCDEQRPQCGQCRKAHRDCKPSSGIVFRHQQNASMNDPDAQEGDSLQGFYAYKNTFTKDSIWVEIPQPVVFVINADPEADFTLDEARAYVGERTSTPAMREDSNTTWTSPSQRDHPFASPMPHSLEVVSATTSGDAYMLSQMSRTASLDAHNQSDQANDTMHNLPTPSTHRSSASTHRSSHSLHRSSGSAHRSPSSTHRSSSSAHHSPSAALSSLSQSYFNQVLNPVPTSTLQSHIAPGLAAYHNTQRLPQDSEVETDHEVAFLLRHFAEEPAPWMDLFDAGRYFTNYVPVKAMTNPILKSAACAYAARQLSLVRGRRPTMGGAATTSALSELYPDIKTADWGYKCTQYYDKAIELLMEGIRDGMVGEGRHSPQTERSPVDSSLNDLYGSLGQTRKFIHNRSLSDSQMLPQQWKWRRKVSQGRSRSDEMTAATAILCDYEQMQEGSGNAWNRHLDGTKSLLDIVAGSMMPLQTSQMISSARKATFWNFARQDFLSALINEKRTRLNPEDLLMWKDAGLLIGEDGFIRPSNSSPNGLPEGLDIMKEDMISNALIWIMDKIVNYLVAADTGPSVGRESWEGINQAALHQKWCELEQHLTTWWAGLPDTFRPCAQLAPQGLPHALQKRASIFPEIWYNNPMCASCMQSYHMARMLLLLNMPQQSTIGKTTYYRRFSSYKDITREIEAHATVICGIAVSRPEGAVRIHSVQPLFTAGQSLSGTNERQEVVRLLREIERDTGWATDYRVRKLYDEWQWPNADGPSHAAGAATGIPHERTSI